MQEENRAKYYHPGSADPTAGPACTGQVKGLVVALAGKQNMWG